MNTLAQIKDIRAIDVRIEEELFYVKLEDGREIGVPYEWYWRLAQAHQAERLNWRLIGDGQGIHWADVDEDISVAGLILGEKHIA